MTISSFEQILELDWAWGKKNNHIQDNTQLFEGNFVS